MKPGAFDPLVAGARIRHVRKRRGLTLDQLGQMIGKPAPYLSQLENGRRKVTEQVLSAIAGALEISPSDILDPTPPSRRASLEIAVERAQEHPRYSRLALPHLRPGTRVPDEALEHVLALFDALLEAEQAEDTSGRVRRADAGTGAWLADQSGHLDHVERAAAEALSTTAYPGRGPITARHLVDLAAGLGFTIHSVDDLPSGLRAVTDHDRARIYIPQRNELRTRQARKAILQALGSVALGHKSPGGLEEWFKVRVETAYFAAAVLVPREAAVPFLMEAKAARDLSIGDLREAFYVSYEMAAHRLVDLLESHAGIPCHLLVSDGSGTVWKWYSADGVPLPRNEQGGVMGMRLCRRWGARQVFDSEDRFALHDQYTDTPAGTFWCTTHLPAGDPAMAVSFGVGFDDARWFRGRTTSRRLESLCPDGECCRPEPPLPEWWESMLVSAARAQQRLVGLSADPWPEPDQVEVAEFLERHG